MSDLSKKSDSSHELCSWTDYESRAIKCNSGAWAGSESDKKLAICPDAITHRMCDDHKWKNVPCAIRDSEIHKYKIRRLELVWYIILGLAIIISTIASVMFSLI